LIKLPPLIIAEFTCTTPPLRAVSFGYLSHCCIKQTIRHIDPQIAKEYVADKPGLTLCAPGNAAKYFLKYFCKGQHHEKFALNHHACAVKLALRVF
jgi:hypothetical protein